MLQENIDTQKFVVQSLAAALAKAKKAAEERERIYAMDDLSPSGLPQIELLNESRTPMGRMQQQVAKNTLDNFNSRKNYDTFAGDMSSIYINPDDLLENVASVTATDRHIYAESIVRQIEDRPELDYSSKRR